jgi:RNA polymerase sigma-70 factor (ECF subfamily)
MMEEYLGSSDTRGVTFTDEASLVREARSNPSRFKQLYLAYIRPIYRYIYSKVGEERQTEDLTAQVFLEALESLPRYRDDGHFTAWLFSIARHKVADYYRLRRPELSMEVTSLSTEAKDDPLAAIIQSEESQHISRLIQRLDEQDQEILRLRLVGELGFKEIGRLTHSSMEATKKRFYRLLVHLRQQLEHDHD